MHRSLKSSTLRELDDGAVRRKPPDAVQDMQDPRMERLPCMHGGTYADDCICERVRQHRCYIVATCDRDLRRRLRKVRSARSLPMLSLCPP